MKKIASGITDYSQANDLGLAKRLGRGEVLPVTNADGSVDVFELPADAAFTPTTQALEIRKPMYLRKDGRIRWQTVGVLPAGAMSQAEAVANLILPEQRAAANLVRSVMTARDDRH